MGASTLYETEVRGVRLSIMRIGSHVTILAVGLSESGKDRGTAQIFSTSNVVQLCRLNNAAA